MLYVNEKWSIPLKEFQFSFARGSGPGGQNVNKLNTKVTLRWDVAGTSYLPAAVVERFLARYRRRINKEGELVLTSHRFRDQGRNVADCLSKLRELINTVSQPPAVRRKTRKPAGAVRRRLENKRRTADKKRSRQRPRADD